jgi:hypothetical protein
MMGRVVLAVAFAIAAVPAVLGAADDQAKPDAGIADPKAPSAPEIPSDRIPTFSLSVEPGEVAIGEVINWRLKIKHRVGDRVHLSNGASFGALEARSKQVKTSESAGDWVEEVLEVQLVGFEPGDVETPAQKLTVVDVDGRLKEMETDSASVVIKSLIANEPEPKLKEDQGPGEKVFERDYTLLWILAILAGIGVVALLTLLGRWLWSKRRPKPAPPPPPPRPAEEIALEKLKALRQSGLLEEGNIKEFHVRLSETIREYLGNRYRFDSLERSTEELVTELRRTTIGKIEFEATVEFLQDTDLVKFAKMIPSLDESRGLLEKSFEFVEKTTPKPVISEEETLKAMKNGEKDKRDA